MLPLCHNLPIYFSNSDLSPEPQTPVSSIYSESPPGGLMKWSECESLSVISDSLQPHGLYRPWNSPGQDTGVGSLYLFQWIFPTQELNWGLLHCRWILYQLSYHLCNLTPKVELFVNKYLPKSFLPSLPHPPAHPFSLKTEEAPWISILPPFPIESLSPDDSVPEILLKSIHLFPPQQQKLPPESPMTHFVFSSQYVDQIIFSSLIFSSSSSYGVLQVTQW